MIKFYQLRYAFIFFPLFLVVSCGYKSFDECMKEEIKQNNNQYSGYIQNYCREKFPVKRSKQLTAEEYFNTQEEWLNNVTILEWKTQGTVTIENTSLDKHIYAFRYYLYSECVENALAHQEDSQKLTPKPEVYNYLFVNVGPKQKITYDIFVPKNSGCMNWNTKGK